VGTLGNKRSDGRPEDQNSEQQAENEAERHLDPFIEQKLARQEFEKLYGELSTRIKTA